MTTGKKALRLLLSGVLVFVAVTSFSLVRHVLAHPGYGLQQNVATWARNKGLGTVVDWLESVTLNDPPAAAPASSLALAEVPDTVPDTSAPTTAPPTTVPVTTSVPASTTTASTLPGETTTTSSTTLPPPVDVAPVISPALRGEGKWRVLFTLGKSRRPVVWGTSMRPFSTYGSVVATAAVFDQTRLRAAMFNGSDIPGTGDWQNWEKVPPAALRSLVAAFNGGFRFEHDPGGYVTEGVTVRKMKRGRATVGIDSSGTLHVGVWGDDMDSRGDWVSLRQNLPPLVEAGTPTWQDHKWTDWGTDFGDKKYTYRSGLCRRTDGSTMFVAANDVNIDLFARLMLLLGCDTGMQLDINGNWPHFSTYSGFGTRNRYGRPLDVR
ncbi:MAG: phosphodiester glycosidase family protein, partial [Acidimicrobiales bacterium]